MIIHRPPTSWTAIAGTPTVFLAGSIEMGTAPDWQTKIAGELPPATILDPRRAEWDASWRQSIDEPKFREQVEWELDGLDRADVIAMWFVPNTKSPITLLELGLYARSGKLLVGCPEGYWRKGNIEVVCRTFDVPLFDTWEMFVDAVRARLAP
jgi:hypothetical protein